MGSVIPSAQSEVEFSITGPAELVGANPGKAEAGIATVLLKAGKIKGTITITATFPGLAAASINIKTN